MRIIRNSLAFLIGLSLAFILFVPRAHAQYTTASGATVSTVGRTSLVFDTQGRIIDTFIDRVGANTSAATASGVAVSSSGNVVARTSGGALTIPTTVVANVPKSAIAKAAGAALRAGNAIGWAWTGYEIYKAIKASGVQVCSASQGFFCKDDPSVVFTGDPTQVGWRSDMMSSGRSAVDCHFANCSFNTIYEWNVTVLRAKSLGYDQWSVNKTNDTHYSICGHYASSGAWNCDGLVWNGTGSPTSVTVPQVAMSDTDLITAVQAKMDADPNFSKKLYDAIQVDRSQRNLPVSQEDIVPSSSPVSVTASPASTPKTVVSTSTQTNPDGSTSTVKKEQQTTVTPTTTGTTVGDTVINYNPTTTTTTTTVNNTTNETTTTTTVENGTSTPEQKNVCQTNPNSVGCTDLGTPPDAEKVPSSEIPVSYTPLSFSSAASCPANVTFDLGPFGGVKAISWQPFCDTLGTVRPIFLACAAAACAWIFLRGFSEL